MSLDDKMKAYAIVIENNEVSQKGYSRLLSSSHEVSNEFDIDVLYGTTDKNVDDFMEEYSLTWTWPDSGNKICPISGMRLHAYGGPPKRRWACAASHFTLWNQCVSINEPILVLEHDAIFTKKLDPQPLIDARYQDAIKTDYFTPDSSNDIEFDIIGINDPRGNTRLAGKFHSIVQNYSKDDLVVPVPVIDDMKVPQGIAGNSAYIIKPQGAKNVIDAVYEYGLMPNDAIMCQQLVPNIGVTTVYYTDTQKLPSTTFTSI